MTRDERKVDLFNTIFQSVFMKSDSERKIGKTKRVRIDKIQFSKKEKETALQALNIGKSKGQDGLTNLPLKRLATSRS